MPDEFETIARNAISEAELVQVSFHEFIQGLETILDEVKTRLEQAREEAGEG